MSMQNLLTLFSSESTIKYIKDIFCVLALPRDAEYQFRYETRHVQNSVRAIFSSSNCRGTRALVAFRSKNTEALDKRFVIPIRWVEIIDVIFVADFYTVKFKVKCFPSFSNDFRDQCHSFQQINAFAREILKDDSINDLAVINNVLSIVGDHNDDKNRDSEYWRNIVSALSLVPQYGNYYFLRCSPFLFADERLCDFRDNITTLEEGICVYLQIEFYQRKYDNADDSKIEVILDNNIISQSSGLKTRMETRYDSVKVGFQPKITINGTISEVIICTSGSTNRNQTEITLPIRIVKRKYSRVLKAIVMTVGACLVGLPGLFPDTIDVSWKILLAFSGAALMGVNYFMDSRLN